MQCPRCQNNGSRVVDSRPADDGRAIRRTREEFNRGKILRGIIRSCEKRPVSVEQVEKIVDEVENKIRSLGENEISSAIIGEYIMEKLIDVDDVAYIRFASVYRQFKDMSVFLSELQELEKMKSKKRGKQ